jgi:hypothetical protein
MKDDLLFGYAFGELSDAEIAKIESELMLDDAFQSEANLLKDLKSDLKSFEEIPEMQFSTERLRDAILGQGLKPKKVAPQWLSWVSAPMALASVVLLAFVFTGGVNRMLGRQQNPVYVSAGSSQSATSLSGPMVAVNESTFSLQSKATGSQVSSSANQTPKSEDEKMQVGRKGNRRLNPRNERAKGLVAALDTSSRPSLARPASQSARSMRNMGVPVGVNNEVAGNVSISDTVPEQGSASIISAAKAEVSPTEIVILNSERDAGTGAAIATEVKNPTNVVIGG